MPKLIVTDREGATHELDGPARLVGHGSDPREQPADGGRLRRLLRLRHLPCLRRAEDWLPRLEAANSDESMMLDEAFEVRDNSRLSCQIKFGPALDGLKVTLAPEF